MWPLADTPHMLSTPLVLIRGEEASLKLTPHIVPDPCGDLRSRVVLSVQLGDKVLA